MGTISNRPPRPASCRRPRRPCPVTSSLSNHSHQKNIRTMRLLSPILLSLILCFSLAPTAHSAEISLETSTIADLQAAMAAGTLSSEKITAAYLARITAYDKQGPALNSVIALNPKALEVARSLDAE